MQPMPPRSRHHHFVPVFMLRRFADANERIVRREARSASEKEISIRDACVVKNLNVAEEVLAPLPADMFEDALAYVDEHSAPLIEELASGTSVPDTSSQARADVAYFLAWLSVRGPHFRDYIDLLTTREWRERAAQNPADVVAAFRQWMEREPTDDEVERLQAGDFDLEWPHGSQMKMAARMAHAYDSVARYGWALADGHAFLISDVPMTYLGPGEEGALGLEDVAFVPLSTKRLLILRDGSDLASPVPLTDAQMAVARRLICERAVGATFRTPGAPFPNIDGTL